MFEEEKFDSVIHLASFPRQKVVNADPTQGSKVMSEGLLNLLELSRQTKVKEHLTGSSCPIEEISCFYFPTADVFSGYIIYDDGNIKSKLSLIDCDTSCYKNVSFSAKTSYFKYQIDLKLSFFFSKNSI